jgi:hypothetical protein
MKSMILAALAILLCIGCTDRATTAQISLEIEGKKHDYKTSHAEYDQQLEGGPYSLYLLRDEGDDATEPFLGMRFFSGNPVARFWLRYPAPGEEAGADLGRWECFVPGKLKDGRDTLSWKKKDGSDRNRQETGEATCTASIAREGDVIVLSYDALLSPRAEKKKKGKSKVAPKGEEKAGGGARIKVKGSARLQLKG